MATCWSVEHNEMQNSDISMSATVVVSLDDIEPSTASATTPYLLDYSLMVTVFAILIFLWVQ
ncbi:MAG: hypothetical protein ETSY1_18630 [Candidatus Entotheonella factor]|uniref:Uncharacterized protein n=1 Tax=Entotheonella factor TaxID=1429438 RepID=W4LKF1_ENTF1|nr:hypothetical protein [Candidatus Entotheonella palauensis]ETW98462.1 MAG: hypothetical protein ETSY1_18630 [Candidatus Entotheonella factor]